MTYTRINYLYRDAGNWKFRGSFIVEGRIDVEDLAPFFIDHDKFVPQSIGLRHLLTEPWSKHDHLLHEIESTEIIEPTELEGETHLCKASELVNRFKRANMSGWFEGFA